MNQFTLGITQTSVMVMKIHCTNVKFRWKYLILRYKFLIKDLVIRLIIIISRNSRWCWIFINNTAAICFHEDTVLTTDQGKIKIKDVKQYHTEKNKIIYVIKSKDKPNKLVLIKKDAFGENIPYFDVKVTLNHTVIVNNKDVPIFNFINDDSVVLINNDNSDVYNLILLNKKYITVNNLNLGVIFMNDNSFDLLEKCVKNTDKHKVSLSLTPQLSTLKNKYLELDIESYNKFKTC